MATNGEITNTAPLWWELQNIPTQAIRELRRRNNSNNIGLSIPQPFTNATFNFEDVYKNAQNGKYGYKGPMTPWVRVFSNSTGKSINGMVPRSAYLDRYYVPVDYDGFILKGGEGFYDAFGYDSKLGFEQTNAIIGYQADGKPHFIDGLYRTQVNYSTRQESGFPQNNQTPSIVPPPGITNITVKQSKELLTYATISFKCFGLAQLEYLTPFFLTAGINVFIEFGWNLFNQQSLLNLSDLNECWEIIEKPQKALDRADKSYGNYGCVSGIITKYSFNTSDGFVYDCVVDMTSRQGMFAGMRTDNNAKISTGTNGTENNIEFLDLRTFFRLYLPSINEVLEQNQNVEAGSNNSKSNFLNYIIDKISTAKEPKLEKDAIANNQQLAKSKQNVTTVIENIKANSNSTKFYGGKPEDRVFIGRLETVYKKKNTIPNPNPIIYGKVNPKTSQNVSDSQTGGSVTQYSSIDTQTDFDGKDGATEVWMQLDFVFELANLFMSNSKTKQFSVDISNVVISAHPNLISCDKNILIPNPVSPKVNKGTIYKQGSRTGGYLKGQDVSSDKNPFISQLQDITIDRNLTFEKKLKEATEKGKLVEFYKSLTEDESFYLACEAARKTFKTTGRIRDNLDILINYLYYNSVNKNKSKPETSSAAFPFEKETLVPREGKDGKTETVPYKRFYFGYLKHIYISKSKLIEIVKSEETKNYKQFINAILNALNSATENFWKFDVVEGSDKNGVSTLSIVDKNMSNFDALQEVYMFELGNTNNVVKSIDFNVSLTNEQAINVLFGGQNSALSGLKDKYSEAISNAQNQQQLDATINDFNKVPFLKFVDRMDRYQLGLLAKERDNNIPSVSTVPGTTSGIEDNNSAIESLQRYGSQEKNNVLCMCVKQVSAAYESFAKSSITNTNTSRAEAARTTPIARAAIEQLNNVPKNYKFLCLPSELRGKLLQMLDDGDYRNNAAKYSGVADNFTVTIKFDGIFSFRNLQVFAISNLPKPYVPGNVIFQILEVDHEISSGKWETTVQALVRCVGSSKLEYITV